MDSFIEHCMNMTTASIQIYMKENKVIATRQSHFYNKSILTLK